MMTSILRRVAGPVACAALLLAAGVAFAADPLQGQPTPGGIDLQPWATEIKESIHKFHTWTLMPIITGVVLLVLALLAYCILRFNAKANPTPSKVTHNVIVEVLWTILPIIILIVIAIPSFQLLFKEQAIPPADLTVKVTGHQWNWEYTYPDNGNFSFSSYMLQDKDRKDEATQPRLLAVDNEMVVPVGKVVRVQVTADTVLHAFFVPSFGVQITAVPGRLNETWFKVDATKPGMYYGECNELCGDNHSYMPIAIRAVTEQEFATWLEQAKQKFAAAPQAIQSAQLEPRR